jgi:hypothetical protein
LGGDVCDSLPVPVDVVCRGVLLVAEMTIIALLLVLPFVLIVVYTVDKLFPPENMPYKHFDGHCVGNEDEPTWDEETDEGRLYWQEHGG